MTASGAPDDRKDSGDSYLDRLNEDRAVAQDALDAALLKLSGGGLGLSFAFVRQFAGANPQRPWLLTGAWLLWGACLVSVTWSHYLSTRVMEEARRRRLDRLPADGGILNKLVRGMNLANTIPVHRGRGARHVVHDRESGGESDAERRRSAGLEVEQGTRTTAVDPGATEQRGRVAPMETTAPPPAPPPQSSTDGGGGGGEGKSSKD